MAVPSQHLVADEILILLYNCPNGRMHCNDVYEALASKFSELTIEDLEKPYQKAKSKWTSTVQYSRLQCTNNGYIYRANDSRSGGTGYWTITDSGKDYVSSNFSTASFITEAEEPEDIIQNQKYLEGSVKQITVNAYERSKVARRTCLQYYGVTCYVCSFDFAATYGKVGEEFIHVHHIKSLSEIGAEYELDPVADLRPICPNCHAIVHRREPAYTIDEVKAFISRQRS